MWPYNFCRYGFEWTNLSYTSFEEANFLGMAGNPRTAYD